MRSAPATLQKTTLPPPPSQSPLSPLPAPRIQTQLCADRSRSRVPGGAECWLYTTRIQPAQRSTQLAGPCMLRCTRTSLPLAAVVTCGSSIESAESNGLARAGCDEPRIRICAAIMTGLTSAPDGSDHRLRPAASVCAVRASRVEPAVGMASPGVSQGLGVLSAAHLNTAISGPSGPAEDRDFRVDKS